MSTQPEIVRNAIQRACEIKKYIQEKVTLQPDESIECKAFFVTEDGSDHSGNTTTVAALMIYAFIFSSDFDRKPRTIDGFSYPDDWDHQTQAYVTIFDGYFLDEAVTNALRSSRPSDIVFTLDMYDTTSD